MSNSFDLSTVTLETLKENGYDEKLIEALKSENFLYLENSDVKSRLQDREFVEPLMYACINSRKLEMFEIYAHLEDRVQSQLLTDYNLSCNILLNAPKVIENTPLAEDERAILANVNNRPEIVRYISNDLMDNPTFVTELSTKNQEVVKEMVDKYPVDKLITANPSLLNNPTFASEALNKDKIAVMELAIKNNESLDKNILDTISDVAKNDAEKATKDFIDEHVKNHENSGFKDLKEYLDKHSEEENPAKSRLILGKMMAELDSIEPEIAKKGVRDALLRIISFERTLQENPDYEITPRDLMGLYSVENLQEEMVKSGLQNEPQIQEMIAQYQDKYIELAEKMIQQREEQGKALPKSFVERIEKLKQQEKQQTVEQSKENAERQIGVAIISGNNTQGLDSFEDLGSVGREEIELTPEQLRQQEADLAARNVPRENVQVVEKTQVSRNEGQDR